MFQPGERIYGYRDCFCFEGHDFSRAAAVATSNRLEPLGRLWFPQPFFPSQASPKTLFASETVGRWPQPLSRALDFWFGLYRAVLTFLVHSPKFHRNGAKVTEIKSEFRV
jgi:hypothetical protein